MSSSPEGQKKVCDDLGFVSLSNYWIRVKVMVQSGFFQRLRGLPGLSLGFSQFHSSHDLSDVFQGCLYHETS